MTNPQRKTNVQMQVVGDGLAVLDQQRRPHVLNATSAMVFQHCDGQTTPQQLADLLRVKFNLSRSQAEHLLWLALDELEKADLLQAKVTTTQAPQGMLSRRQALKAFAAAGLSLALMPIVASRMEVHAADPTTLPPTTLPPTTLPPTTLPPTTLPPTTLPPTTLPPTTLPPTTLPPTTLPPTTLPPTTLPPTFSFTGFFPPVDNPPVFNVAKAGSSIPVKFSLGGYQGMDIFALGYPMSRAVACDSGAPSDDIEEETTSTSGLHYDPDADQYIYVWKTAKRWSGTCRKLVLRLTDGTDHEALFTFR